MSNLFLIGNGFDLSHGLKTSYEDFHQYLLTDYPDATSDRLIVPSTMMGSDGGWVCNVVDNVSLLLYLISNAEQNGDQWRDFERALGLLGFSECFDDLPEMFDDDGDRNPWHEVHNNEDRVADIGFMILNISDFFADWVMTIDIDKSIPSNPYFSRLIEKESDYFLTFNYTETLEILYQVKNVCHIHGKKGEALIFGHGNDKDYSDYYVKYHIGAEDTIEYIQRTLQKDTIGALNNHIDFFNKLSSGLIRNIYSFGFSFSEVDQVYIQEICKRISTAETVWYLHDYDSINRRKHFQEVIVDSGFKGIFDTFTT